MNTYQQYILSADARAIRGSMDWASFYVDAPCPRPDPADPYAVCAADGFYGVVVTDFVPAMNGKA